MASAYPAALDTTAEQPSPTATTDLNESGYEHDVLHRNASEALIALETKVGLTNSNAVSDSILTGKGAATSEWDTSPTVSGTFTAGALTTGGAVTATGDVTAAAITGTGTVTGGNLTTGGDVTATGGVTGATITGTVQTAAQANITSLGTLTGLTLAGAVAFADNQLTRPELKDYSEAVVTVAASTSTLDIDFQNGNVHDVTLDASTVTLTFTEPPASGKGGAITIIARQDASGSRNITWPASVKWAGGSAPTLTTTASRADIFTFVTVNAGGEYFGFVAGQDWS